MLLNNKEKKIYFLGIGGSGMTPLALLLKKNGYTVAGSDAKKSENTNMLEKESIPVNFSHQKENIRPYDLIVFSSAIKENCPEKQEAFFLNKQIVHRSEVLAYFVKKYFSITVAGTHGKTTTSALVEHALNTEKTRAISVLGGESLSNKNHQDLKNCDFFVAEADESDGTFLNYNPSIALVTNIEEDHLDFFKNYDNVKQSFKKHIQNIKNKGTYIYNHHDETCQKIASCFDGKKISFGFDKEASVYATNIRQKEEGLSFEINTKTERYLSKTPLRGRHNILNILGSFCVAQELNLSPTKTIESFAKFKGVKRRLELIYNTPSLKVFDDYAHNPGKILASLLALKKHFPNFKLITIFQPHRFSRLETMYKTLLSSLKSSDLILVCPVFKAGEEEKKEQTPEKIAEDIESFCNKKAKAVYNIKEVIEIINSVKNENTIVSSVGAGDVSKLAHKIGEHLQCNSSLLKKVS